MSDPDPARPPEPEPRTIEDWLAGFTRDATLRPVLVVALGCLSAIGAGALLAAIRGRSLAAIGAVTLLVVASVDLVQRDLRRRRRLGTTSRLALALWALSILAALGAVLTGLA